MNGGITVDMCDDGRVALYVSDGADTILCTYLTPEETLQLYDWIGEMVVKQEAMASKQYVVLPFVGGEA